MADLNVLLQFPFHLENGGSIFNGDRAEHLDKGISLLLSITELRESVLKDISFNDQKSLALTCKTAFVAAGHFYVSLLFLSFVGV